MRSFCSWAMYDSTIRGKRGKGRVNAKRSMRSEMTTMRTMAEEDVDLDGMVGLMRIQASTDLQQSSDGMHCRHVHDRTREVLVMYHRRVDMVKIQRVSPLSTTTALRVFLSHSSITPLSPYPLAYLTSATYKQQTTQGRTHRQTHRLAVLSLSPTDSTIHTIPISSTVLY